MYRAEILLAKDDDVNPDAYRRVFAIAYADSESEIKSWVEDNLLAYGKPNPGETWALVQRGKCIDSDWEPNERELVAYLNADLSILWTD